MIPVYDGQFPGAVALDGLAVARVRAAGLRFGCGMCKVAVFGLVSVVRGRVRGNGVPRRVNAVASYAERLAVHGGAHGEHTQEQYSGEELSSHSLFRVWSGGTVRRRYGGLFQRGRSRWFYAFI